MIKPIPSVDVYQHKKSGAFLIIHNAPHFQNGIYQGNVGFGSIESILEKTLSEDALPIMRSSLEEFPKRKTAELGALDRMTLPERKKFFADHRSVGISLRNNGDLWIDPVHHKRVGVSGYSEADERGVVPADADNQTFLKILFACLAKAS